MTEIPHYILSIDFGQVADYTAIVLAEIHGQRPTQTVHIRDAARLPLGTSYPTVVEEIAQRYEPIGRYLQSLGSQAWSTPIEWLGYRSLVCDITGVGRPVYEMLCERLRQEPKNRPDLPTKTPVAITFKGGTGFDSDPKMGGGYLVAKVDLVASLAVLLQVRPRRILISETLPQLEPLLQECVHFRQKVSLAGNPQYEAWRERDHDDMAFACMMACWYAQSAHNVRTSKVTGL